MSPGDPFPETLELLRRAKAGDEACLARVLSRYEARLLRRIRLFMGGQAMRAAESSDVLQDVFLKVLEHFDQFEIRDEHSFLRWTTVIARNNLRMQARKDRETALASLASASGEWSVAASEQDSPLREAARLEQIAHVVDVLADMEDDHRLVIELRNFEQLPFAEVGRRLGRSENAAQLLHARAVIKLSSELQQSI